MTTIDEIGKICYLSTKQVILHQLEDLENLTKDLFESLSRGFAQRGSITELENVGKITDHLIEKDKQLQRSVVQAIEQVKIDQKMKEIEKEFQTVENEIMQLHNNLKEADNLLATALHQARKKLDATEEAKRASVSCEELIRFAFRISTGSSVEAPPEWVPGDPRRPYPLDIEMRCGMLGQLSQKPLQNIIATDESIADISANPMHNIEKEKNNSLEQNNGNNLTRNDSANLLKNGGAIWQGPLTEDVAHLATMPVSAMMTNHSSMISTSINGSTNIDEVGYMSSSSDSSSSGESG